jgi:hypothetical protein
LNSLDPRAAKGASSKDIFLANTRIRVQAPEQIISVLEATLSDVPGFAGHELPDVTISVVTDGETWQIFGADGSRKVLTGQSALPRVAGAVVSSAISDTAETRDFVKMRAAVVEKGGRALAMIGDDWESAITLAMHLHSRGWRCVGSDNALIDAKSRQVHCVQKALYVNASSVAQLPVRYRRAVEASPWYVTAQGISFYAVDPTVAGTGIAWTPMSTLCGVIVVDGAVTDSPSLEPLDAHRMEEERLSGLGLDFHQIAVGELLFLGRVR